MTDYLNAHNIIIIMNIASGFGGLFLVASNSVHTYQVRYIKPKIVVFILNLGVVTLSVGCLATSYRSHSILAGEIQRGEGPPFWMLKDIGFFEVILALSIWLYTLIKCNRDNEKKIKEIKKAVEDQKKGE